MLKSSGRGIDNGLLEVYMYARCDDGSDIAKMMRIFIEDEAYDYRLFPELSARKEQYKKTKEGFGTMCELVEEYNAKASGEGILKARLRVVLRWL